MNLSEKQKYFFLLIAMGIMLLHERVHAEDTTSEKKGALDQDLFSYGCDRLIGKHIKPIVKDFSFGIKRLPGFDDALDAVGKISPIDVEMGFTVANIYLSRGEKIGNHASWMPYVSLSPDFEPLGDLKATYWSDITRRMPGTNHLEDDWILEYTVEIPDIIKIAGGDVEKAPYLLKKALDFCFTTGYWYYWYPPTKESTKEISWGINYHLPLNPTVTVYNDYVRGKGLWWEWGISQDFDLKLFTLSTFAIMGYNHRQWSVSSRLSMLYFGGSIPISIGSHMKIEPFLSYSKRLKRTFRLDEEGELVDITHDELYGGFNYVITF